jgi:hypothetical protein
VVVLSPHFFAKRWPREELEGLFQLETTERKVILPIWKDVSVAEVKEFSPILASRLAGDASAGIPKIVNDIRRTVGLVDRYKQISSAWKQKLKKLHEDVGHARRVAQFSGTEEAVALVSKVALEIIDEAWRTAEQLVSDLSALKLHLSQRKSDRHYFAISGPNALTLHLHFNSPFTNSIEATRLRIAIFRAADDWGDRSEMQILEKYELRPGFDREMKVFWMSSDLTFATGTALLAFAFDKFVSALSGDQ